MDLSDVVLFPSSFAGALVGIVGMILAPDGTTAVVASVLFLACALLFGALIVWYPVRGAER